MRALLPLALSCALLLPATSAGQGDESSKPAEQILADVAHDLATVHSYHVDATETDKTGTSRLIGDVAASGNVRFSVREHGLTVRMIVTSTAVYMRAPRAFWRREEHVKSADVLKLLSGRWVKVPAAAISSLRDLAKQFAPATLAHCVTSTDNGTITKRGTTTFAGHRVIVLASKGDKPGTAPGLLYVTTAGRILPLRALQTGRQRAGKASDPQCSDDSGTATTRSDVRLSRFDKPVKIGPPAKPLSFGEGSAPS